MFRTDSEDDRTARDHIGAIGDFWNYLKEDRPHKWTSMALAITIVGVVLYQIYASLIQPPPPRTILYVESWPATRTQAQVEADWKDRAIQANEDNAKRRAAYRSVADALGIEYEKAPGTEGGPAINNKNAPDQAQPTTSAQPVTAPASPEKAVTMPVEDPIKQGH